MLTTPIPAYRICFCQWWPGSPKVAEYTVEMPRSNSTPIRPTSTQSQFRWRSPARFMFEKPLEHGSRHGRGQGAAVPHVLEHHGDGDAGILDGGRANEKRVGLFAVGVLRRAGLAAHGDVGEARAASRSAGRIDHLRHGL